MRVTQGEMYRTFNANIRDINEDLAEVNNQVSSEKKLNDLADSPSGSSALVMISDQALKVETYHSNIDTTTYYLQSAETSLNEANNLLSSIQVLGAQMVSGSISSDTRASLVNQLRMQRDQMMAIGNSQVDGHYLFAGTRTTSIPFELNGDRVIYNGNEEVNKVPVSEGVELSQGVSGSSAFGSIFNTIDGFLANLDAGDMEGAKASLTQFADSLDQLSLARGEIGANLNQLQNMSGVLETKKAALTARKSSIDGADMVGATLRLSQLKSALDGALSVGGTILKQSNLFDILG
jgi:flagellar hook-associated protein 3 FlgL